MDVTQHSKWMDIGTCTSYEEAGSEKLDVLLEVTEQVCCRFGFEPVQLPNQGAFSV